MSYQDIINKRQSVYALNNTLPIEESGVISLIEDAIVASPSAFNVQSVHAIILLGAQHTYLWNTLVADTLKAIVPAEGFAQTQQKLASFAAGAGTILFFEDDAAIAALKEQYPTYAANFDAWSDHGQGIAQANVWNALAEKGIGANLQHYNPIIDDAVRARWNVPAQQRLIAQMVFGGIAAPTESPARKPAAERIRVER